MKPYPGPEAHSDSVQTLPYRVDGRVYYPLSNSAGFVQEGIASWYGRDFHGKLTSNGEVYNMNSLTAAHKTLPFNSVVRVTHRESGKSITVRINDRGPFVGDRIIDLSYGAANKLGMAETGTAPVSLRVIKSAKSSPPRNAVGTSAKKGIYSVQVGVFENLENARNISHQFNNSRVFAVKRNNRKLYKVLVGEYSNYEKALKPMDQMRHRGFKEAFIVLSP
jgi:rare lipoprotein A